tara:strand:- start:721 stop:936 length:216 start_codon:yes stop_codon:yes gene_type:complete
MSKKDKCTKKVRELLKKHQNEPNKLPEWLIKDLFDDTICYKPLKKPYNMDYLKKSPIKKIPIGKKYQADID